jgi:hypothetical protein
MRSNRPIDGRPARARECRRRGGFTLFELAIGLILLMAAMTLTVKMLAWVGAERRAADRRQWAIHALSNALERLSSEPFDRVTNERARALLKESPFAGAVPTAEWDATVVADQEAPVASKRVSVRVRWPGRSGEWDAPVVLSTWVCRRRDAS